MTEFPYAEANLEPCAVKMFKPVLAWLDDNAPHVSIGQTKDVGFNMEYFNASRLPTQYFKDARGDQCGTVCCIAGAIFVMNKRRFRGEVDLKTIGPKLGMTNIQVRNLFYGDFEEIGASISLDTITPSMAAATVRRFLKTGKVSWDHRE